MRLTGGVTVQLRPEPQPRALTDDGRREFLAAASRVFNFDADDSGYWPAWMPLYEPDRFFGLSVDDRWISTCGAFTRRMTVPGGSVPVAAVTFVSVSPSYRRQGILRRMMTEQLEDVYRRGEPISILWASESPIYGRFGYGSAVPRLRIAGPTRLGFRPNVATEPGWVEDATRETYAAEATALHARLLSTRPGALDRGAAWWERDLFDGAGMRRGVTPLRFTLRRDAAGEVDGYALHRVSTVDGSPEVRILDLDAASDGARVTLWRYLLDLDLVGRFTAHVALDDPLRHLVTDQRAVETRLVDSIYVRLVDVGAALAARTYTTPVDVVVGVVDETLPRNTGSWRLVGGPDGAEATRSDAAPDLELDVCELGAAYLGGTSLRDLARAGLVTERTPGAVVSAARAFEGPQAPYCPDFF
jgi:predicted acetyltransferase